MNRRTLAIITGCNGFTGRYLVSCLRESRGSFDILGMDIHDDPLWDVDIYVKSSLERQFTDTIRTDLENAEKILCFHLAGQIFNQDVDRMRINNLTATRNTLLSLVPYREKTVVLNVGSSAEYGYQGKVKITEDCTPEPVSRYGSCKLLQTQLARDTGHSCGLSVIATRTFNLIGPGQTDRLFCGNLARQIAAYKAREKDRITVGDLSAYRDFLDVRDAVRAYLILVRRGRAGQMYNIASGRMVKTAEVLAMMIDMAGINPGVVHQDKAPGKQQVPYQQGCIEKIRKETGWAASYQLERSLMDMIEHERRSFTDASKEREGA
ncbi:MAG: NAD-dependent epimerase/dehydratase family protein [Candidatus Omnitrophica bacterium]|nr:NAD-dependent epimerase/dehydratase family protein [Candidatus Omnitrophota bacterium]